MRFWERQRTIAEASILHVVKRAGVFPNLDFQLIWSPASKENRECFCEDVAGTRISNTFRYYLTMERGEQNKADSWRSRANIQVSRQSYEHLHYLLVYSQLIWSWPTLRIEIMGVVRSIWRPYFIAEEEQEAGTVGTKHIKSEQVQRYLRLNGLQIMCNK